MINEVQAKITQACVLDNTKNLILKDRYILSDNYDPDKILHREEEINEINDLLHFIYNHGYDKHLNISGDVGTGKTMLCRHMTRHFILRTEAEGRKFKSVYVNCRQITTQNQLLRKIALELTGINKIGLGKSDIIETIKKDLDGLETVILILDEVHYLAKNKKESEVFYDIFNEDKFTIIVISNVSDWVEKYITDIETKSRIIGMVNVHFPPYNMKQIHDILQYRAEKALHPNVYDSKTLDIIAKKVSDRGGDMREALRILTEAADIAQNSGRVEIDDV